MISFIKGELSFYVQVKSELFGVKVLTVVSEQVETAEVQLLLLVTGIFN